MLTHEQRLTPEMLAAIRERAERATPGPWHWNDGDYTNTNGSLRTSNGDLVCHFGGYAYYETFAGCEPGAEDTEFIAHAREDVPALIAEIIRLRTALAEMAHYEAPYGLDAQGYEVLRIMARQALNDGGDAE